MLLLKMPPQFIAAMLLPGPRLSTPLLVGLAAKARASTPV